MASKGRGMVDGFFVGAIHESSLRLFILNRVPGTVLKCFFPAFLAAKFLNGIGFKLVGLDSYLFHNSFNIFVKHILAVDFPQNDIISFHLVAKNGDLVYLLVNGFFLGAGVTMVVKLVALLGV